MIERPGSVVRLADPLQRAHSLAAAVQCRAVHHTGYLFAAPSRLVSGPGSRLMLIRLINLIAFQLTNRRAHALWTESNGAARRPAGHSPVLRTTAKKNISPIQLHAACEVCYRAQSLSETSRYGTVRTITNDALRCC